MITFKEYQKLSTDDQLTIYEACRASRLPKVDCTNWLWGQVKFTQDEIKDSVDFSTLLKIVRFETILTEHSEASLVIRFFLAIKQSIQSIEEMEAAATAYQPSAKEIAAAEEVGGFEVFGTLPQTLRLVGVVAQDVKSVEAMDYNTCFAALVYTSKLNDFQRIIARQ